MNSRVVALIVLILLLVLLGGGGLLAPALNFLWLLLVIGLILWVLGFFVRAAEGSRWYYW
ncbi:MAG TPA: hydrophobic protein [Candidatus Dormibacteraeota bacterium]